MSEVSTFFFIDEITRSKIYDPGLHNLSKVDYINPYIPVIIIDHHGFEHSLKPLHIRRKGIIFSLESAVDKTAYYKHLATSIHGKKYGYDSFEYVNKRTRGTFKCGVHGYFKQSLDRLLIDGCPMCSNSNNPKTDNFIEKAIAKHGDKYGYKLAKYTNADTKVTITCGDHTFEQTPDNHLRGKGCPRCITSKGEDKILKYLKENNIIHKQEHRFKDCRNKQPLPFDFYIPHLNTCIEFDGVQHFQSVERFGGEVGFQNRIVNDNIKSIYCENNNIRLIRIRYDQISKINDILSDHLSLIELTEPVMYQ